MRKIRRCLVGLLPLIVLASGTVPAAGTHYHNRIAVCIGISQYAGHRPLACPVRDATLMADVFEAYGFDQVVLMTDRQAGRDRIVAQLHQLAADMHPDDLFVFYFAGHGQTVRHETTGPVGYLLPMDCRRGHESEDGISMQFITGLIRRMPARHSVLLMDACYSGYAVAESRPGSGPGEEGHLVHILASGGEMDRAFEGNDHGLFTRHVLNFFRDSSGMEGVSTQALAAYVISRVRRETAGWQAPRFARSGEGDILIAMNKPPDNRIARADLRSWQSSSSSAPAGQ